MFVKRNYKFQTERLLKTQSFRKRTTAVNPKQQINFNSNDYQFFQKSSIPTLHFQKSLLRLPVPELDKTCERYLNALTPILEKNQYNKTLQVVQKFKEKNGVFLQEKLKANDDMNKHTSYISKPWFDMYLKDRAPLPINYNPVIVFNKSIHPSTESQLCKATNLTISSLRFMKSLKYNTLAPEMFHLNPEKTNTEWVNKFLGLLPSMIASYGAYFLKVFPLDMSQYSSLFSNTRIPQEGKDILVKDESARHVVVLRKGHFFIFDVLNEEGEILPPQDIFTCFKYILEKNLEVNKEPIGVLTTENRDVWAKSRKHLVSIHPDNFSFIEAIDSALLVLCFDDEPLGEDPIKIMRSFLHGDGINRWFDKSFNLIIAKDGVSGVNFEHAWGDGVAILRYIKDIYADINNNAFVDCSTEPSKISPENLVKKLDFNLDEKVLTDVRKAKESHDKICNSLGINIVKHDGLGRRICKTSKISPDALMQLSFQVAYHKVFGNFVSSYESCSTAAFKHGRTETIRPCTIATQNLALKMNSKGKPSKEELFSMIMQCSEIHKNLTKEAAMGQGFDRHLFGLKNICQEEGHPLPELFEDEAYKLINYNIISTSTLSADAVMMGGFGPVVPDGFGIGYSIVDNTCGSIVTSYPANRNGGDFTNALKLTFEELSALLNK